MRNKTKTILEQISVFRDELIAFVESLPDGNEGVTFLDKKKTCASVNLSTIMKSPSMNLSASYYLNHTAKKELLRLVKATSLERLDKVLQEIIQTGFVPVQGGRPITANPEFITKVKEMWEKIS